MREITIFTKSGCAHCEELIIPDGLNVSIIDVNSPDYKGHIPPQVPAVQILEAGPDNPLQATGAVFINQLLQTFKSVQNGFYNQQ